MTTLPEYQHLEFPEHPWPDVPHLILIPTEDTDEACLNVLLEHMREFSTLLRDHPKLEEDEPWFAWAFQRGEHLQSELQLLNALQTNADLLPLVAQYVEYVIQYFVNTNAEPGFYVHEEKEAGSDAIHCLLKADASKYLSLYFDFLRAIDLEHTVAQADALFRLQQDQLLTAEQWQQLSDVVADCGGEHLINN